MDKDVEWRPPGTPCLPRYPTEFKKTVVLYAEKFSNREAERTFGIAESNIRRWKKLKSILFSDGFASDTSESNSLKKRGPKSVTSSFEDSLGAPDIDHFNQISEPKKEEKDSDDEEVCLRWNSHHDNMKNMFPMLLKKEQFVDVTLSSGKKTLKCHKLILSSCSAYFENMLSDVPPNQHVIIFLNTIPFWLLQILVDFMYTGEVHIDQSKLQELLTVAETLQIKGLAGKSNKKQSDNVKNKQENATKSINIDQRRSLVIPQQSKMDVKPIINKEVQEKQQNVKKKLIKPLLDDSMPLLKPNYAEDEIKKDLMGKKSVKKRKSCDQESAPPILYRKGTKSRPQVKVPRYYHNEDYDHDDLKPLRARHLNPNEIETKKEKKENDDDKSDSEKTFTLESCLEDSEVKIKTEIFEEDDETKVIFTEIPSDKT
ncbi:uncharacterized protein [Onthophagus taurus]|uniref:uncharacterized protein n=1 Tax=Onthophagus taurus TaxID=166361 RepID=UPI0039BE61B7